MPRVVVIGSALALALAAVGAWRLSEQNRAEADRKMRELERMLQEAQAREAAQQSERPAGPRDQRGQPEATGGAPTHGPTDFPLRKSEPPEPLEKFLRKPAR